MIHPLPSTCERALLERFLKAEAMALWAVRSAQAKDVPPGVLQFLRRHEEEEAQHLKQFEQLLGTRSHEKTALPRVPTQWWALAVHLYGYETLGLEFAKLLIGLRPDLTSILEDEEVHVGFFEDEVRTILAHGGAAANGARQTALSWRRRLPGTVDRYLEDESLTQFRDELRQHIHGAIDDRFIAVGLLARSKAPLVIPVIGDTGCISDCL
ncbi:MAG: ferritin-like domain-containing protein [Nitrospira sp.]|nr:ferritin-like domain-containing protein [Nitrospira sp.]